MTRPRLNGRLRSSWIAGAAGGGVLVLGTVLVAGLGTSGRRPTSAVDARPISTVPVPTTTAPAPTTTVPSPTTTVTTTPAPTTTVAPPTIPPTTVAASTTASPVASLPGISGASQVVTVTTTGYGTDVATVTAYQLQSGVWQRAFGPYQGNVGLDGLAPPGEKREGDLRTPSGTFGFGTFFGVDANPGVRFPWLAITGTNDVWDDDPSSPNYNQYETTTSQAVAGANPEPMDNTPAYDYGALIDYNTDPVVAEPPMGSAIFFHVSTGGGTAGCVSIPQPDLVPVLLWLDPAQSPVIVIGTESSLGLR